MTVENPISKSLRRPITTKANNAMYQSELHAITCNFKRREKLRVKGREKLRVQGAINFSHWLKKLARDFAANQCSNRNSAITFDSHLKTTLKKHKGT